ncbi:MAG TPA: hypothetical protein VFE16_08820 [Candidatus Cybelea sp.]|jgi:hypothetical protein|nr:hypothetical protein [Candidatus Cybelea sp.]
MPDGAKPNFQFLENRFPYKGVPSRVKPDAGDLLFLAYGGKIVGAAPILKIPAVDQKDDMEYLERGRPKEPAAYSYIVVGKLKRITGSPPYRGHMGIRYVDRLSDAKMRRFLQSVAATLKRHVR